jgi:hypothetical protein
MSAIVYPRCNSGINLFEYRAMSKIIFKPKYAEIIKKYLKKKISIERNIHRFDFNVSQKCVN